MARLALTVQEVVSGYPVLPVVANSLDVVFTNAGAAFVDGAGFPFTGREILLVQNKNAGAQTVTISSVKDERGRTGDVTSYSLGIGEFMAICLPTRGFRQADGKLYFAASATDVAFAVLRLPALV